MKHLIEENLRVFDKARKNLINSLLAVKETKDMDESLKILAKERLLPYGDWISDCPELIYEWLDHELDGYYEKYQTIDYLKVCDDIYEELHGEKSEEVLDRYHNFLIRHVFRYVKENKIIGFKIDW